MKIANLQQQLESARHQTEVVRTNVELESVFLSPQIPEYVVVSPKKHRVFNPSCSVATPKFGSNSVPPPSPQIRGEDASAGVLTGAAAENPASLDADCLHLRKLLKSRFSPLFHTAAASAVALTQQVTESDARSRVGSRGDVESRRWNSRCRRKARR